MTSFFQVDKYAAVIRLAENDDVLSVRGDAALNNLVHAVRLVIGKKQTAIRDKIAHHTTMLNHCGYEKGKEAPNGLDWAVEEIEKYTAKLAKLEKQAAIIEATMARTHPELLAACVAARTAEPRRHLCCGGLEEAIRHANDEFDACVDAFAASNELVAKLTPARTRSAKKRKQTK